ncbi:Metallophos domain-containing protein [Durusdinium trenchii]|uniref:Metallophos domain-containing protein n=1 Tax=Durusdinium trenchii TaxID=1381693 RepID=A0ABP0SQC4_9DINO
MAPLPGGLQPDPIIDCTLARDIPNPYMFRQSLNLEGRFFPTHLDGLSKSSADWQFVATHFPVEHGLDQWKALSKTFGIDLILTAHRHIQEVHVDDEVNLVKPTAWIVSGGGGGITSEGTPTEDGQDDQWLAVEEGGRSSGMEGETPWSTSNRTCCMVLLARDRGCR